jgi:hypothetical protein
MIASKLHCLASTMLWQVEQLLYVHPEQRLQLLLFSNHHRAT